MQYNCGLVVGTTCPDPTAVMSGLVVLPAQLAEPIDTAIWVHETQTVHEKVPSNAFKNFDQDPLPLDGYGSYAVFGALISATLGLAGLAPDGMGMGDSAGTVPYPYVVGEGYAIAGLNLYAAAKELAPAVIDGQILSGTVFTAGYSEGGYGAAALHRLAMTDEWAAAGAAMHSSFPSAGPYDLRYTQAERCVGEMDSYPNPSFMLYVGYGFGYFAPLGLDPTEIFNTDFNGVSVVEYVTQWVASGVMSSSEIDAEILATFSESRLDMINPDVVSALNGDAGVSSSFVEALEANALTDSDWLVGTGSKIYACHSPADKVVYIENAYRLRELMPDQVSLYEPPAAKCADHTDCGIPCMAETVRQLERIQLGSSDHKTRFQAWASSPVGITVLALIGLLAGGLTALICWRCCCREPRDQYEQIA